LANIFFTDDAVEKTNQKFSCTEYNIPRYKSFTDEATQLPSILKNVLILAILKIVSIKATEFSSQFRGKIGAAEEKSLAP
jgi:hypothetical protein